MVVNMMVERSEPATYLKVFEKMWVFLILNWREPIPLEIVLVEFISIEHEINQISMISRICDVLFPIKLFQHLERSWKK